LGQKNENRMSDIFLPQFSCQLLRHRLGKRTVRIILQPS
jgi:hypothetical protein